MLGTQALSAYPSIQLRQTTSAETAFDFNVSADGPVCARLHSARPRPAAQETIERFSRFERFKAFQIEEPHLSFKSLDGKASNNFLHPIQGLVSAGGPFEAYNSALHTHRNIRVGVICAAGHERLLSGFLNMLRQPATVGPRDDEEYVIPFPGFEQGFGVGLSIPQAGKDATWISLPFEPPTDPIEANSAAITAVTNAVRRIDATGAVDVLVVYIPTSWEPFERISSETLHLNLHDQIKAFCAQKQVRSQLLREVKVRTETSARIRWWLSLALYTKSLRTPWMLAHQDEDVAYMGLDYAYDPDAIKNHRIVVGCSHVFNADGVGMQFRLSELQSPEWRSDPLTRQKSPFMSRDDAYRLGVRTREVLFKKQNKLPARMLVAKQTPFTDKEVAGLLSALEDIRQLDLVTVQHEDNWRFCSYDAFKGSAGGFPTKRGTALLLNKSEMLLWLHGNVQGVNVKNSHWSYFQGKSRIPTPVRVSRYSGSTSAEVIGRDLIALTRMDWNTFALYKSLPVTLTTPGKIAKVAKLLGETTVDSYDYRLFM